MSAPKTETDQPVSIQNARKSLEQRLMALAETESRAVKEAGGFRLADDLLSPINLPQQPLSAMDGYSFHSSCLDKSNGMSHISLVISGKSLAGHPLQGQASVDTAVRIFTGAALPPEHDTVIAQERVDVHGETGSVRFEAQAVGAGANVRLPGEDLKQGVAVLKKGDPIHAREIALLCSIGIDTITVFRRTRVAVLSSGDELCDVGAQHSLGKIYDANRPMLLELVRGVAAETLDLGIVNDEPTALRDAILHAADNADVVISSGGVGVGEADHTTAVLQSLGEISFWKLAIKPGRPLAAGWVANSQGKRIPFFGLPGNPVAAFVTFKAVIEPCLELISGGQRTPAPPIRARLASDAKKAIGRTEFLRCALRRDADGEWLAEIASSQGAASIKSLVDADGLVVLPHEAGPLAAGSPVDVIVLR
jgi:molybdopterin molybdotransferase